MITGMPCIAIAMHGFDAGVETFRREFGMPVCRPPSGGVIEFVSPSGTDRPFAREVATLLDDREGLYALVLRGNERQSITVCGARIIVERPDP